MVPEQLRSRDRAQRKVRRCSFDLLIQACLLFSSLLMIGSVIFSAYTVRLELNGMHKTQYKSDKKLEKLEQQVKQLSLFVEKELAKRKWSRSNGQQMRQSGSRRNKSGQTQTVKSTRKLPRPYGIFYARQRSFEKHGQTLPVQWESCANNRSGCPRPKHTGDITIASKSSFRIVTGGIYHFTCHLTLSEKYGITFQGRRTIIQIVSKHGGSSKVLLSRMQSTNQTTFHLSGLGIISNNSVVSVIIVSGDNSMVSRVEQIVVDTSIPAGSFFSFFLVETDNKQGSK